MTSAQINREINMFPIRGESRSRNISTLLSESEPGLLATHQDFERDLFRNSHPESIYGGLGESGTKETNSR